MKRRKKYILEGWFKRNLAGLFDTLGYAVNRPRPGGLIEKESLRKVLLIRLDHIGDVLMTTPALRALRREYPDTEIHILVKASSAGAVRGNKYLDRVVIFNAPWTAVGKGKATISEVFRIAGQIREERYDCVIDFRADPREALLTLSSGAPYRLGYGDRGGGFCFTHLENYDPGEHEIKKNLQLLRPLGVESDDCGMDFFFTPEEMKRARDILNSAGGGREDKWVGILPGAASTFKRWREEGFARLGEMLAQEGYRIVLLGSPVEEGLLRRVARRMKSDPLTVGGESLKVVGALISRLSFIVCNDTAPSHIAQAVGTKAIVLYGPTHDEVTGPLDRSKNIVVRNPVSCSPCWLPGTRFSCARDLRCWKGLSAEKVFDVILRSES